MRVRAFVLMVPGPDQQGVGDDEPSARCPPTRLRDEGAGDVAAGGGDVHARRGDPEPAGVAVQHRPEHAGRIHPRQAQPLDTPIGGDECGGLAVGQKCVVVDRRKVAVRERGTVCGGINHSAPASCELTDVQYVAPVRPTSQWNGRRAKSLEDAGDVEQATSS